MFALFEQIRVRRMAVATLAAAAGFSTTLVQAQPVVTAPLAPAPTAPATPAPGTAAIPLPSSPMSATTAAEIQKINEQMTLLQAQLNQLELKAKIAGKQREISGTAAPAVQSSFDSRSGNPSVLSVAGLKGNLEAVLVFPGGVTQRVRAGDVIDERRVARVAINEVVLTDLKGKNLQRLAFGTVPMTRERSGVPGLNAAALMPLPPNAPLPLLPR